MRRPACHRHKMIRLVNNPLSWIEDIRNTWQDLLDRSRPFTIRIVRPRPPQFREHQSRVTSLWNKRQWSGKVVAILTALIEGTPNDAIIQSAYSLDQRVNTATIIRTMDITRFCAGRECALYYDRQAVPGLDWIEVQSGSSLYIRIRNVIAASETLALDNETHQHFADLSLMQTSTFVLIPMRRNSLLVSQRSPRSQNTCRTFRCAGTQVPLPGKRNLEHYASYLVCCSRSGDFTMSLWSKSYVV